MIETPPPHRIEATIDFKFLGRKKTAYFSEREKKYQFKEIGISF